MTTLKTFHRIGASGNRGTPYEAATLVDAIEAAIPPALRHANRLGLVGNVAGFRITGAVSRFEPEAIDPAPRPIPYSVTSETPPLSRRPGIVVTITGTGYPLVSGAVGPEREYTIYFEGTAEDLPSNPYKHTVAERNRQAAA